MLDSTSRKFSMKLKICRWMHDVDNDWNMRSILTKSDKIIMYNACVMLIMNVREKMSFVIDGFSHKAANIINNEHK